MNSKELTPTQTLFINIFGGPGCGKSVSMAKLFVALKVAGYTVEMVDEYAKSLVFENRTDEFENQIEVARHQYNRLRARKHADINFVITDGPLANALFYNRTYPHLGDIEKTEAKILRWMEDFPLTLNLYLHRGDFAYEQNGRYQTEAQAKAMDKPIYELLVNKGVDLKALPFDWNFEDVKSLIAAKLKESTK